MSNIVLRSEKPTGQAIIPKQLLAKKKLTSRERIFLNWEIYLLLALVPLIAIGVLTIVFKSGVFWDLLGSAIIALGAGSPLPWIITEAEGDGKEEEKVFGYRRARKRMVYANRERLSAAHAPDRVKRAKDVTYPQFSVYVKRASHEVTVGVTKHEGSGRIWREHGETRFGFDQATGTWGHFDGKQVRVHQPSLERLRVLVDNVGEVAASLEEQAYDEEAKKLKLERLVSIHQAPVSGPRERAQHHKDEIEDGVAGLLTPGTWEDDEA